MKFQFKFKGIDHSQSLCDHVAEKFEKLEKFEMKPTQVNVTFSASKHERKADVYVKGLHKTFRASAHGESYYDAVDMVASKIEKQMSKEKSKVQHHKNPALSHEARLDEAIKHEKSVDEEAA
jgi:putative sigma-54 modulation protein